MGRGASPGALGLGVTLSLRGDFFGTGLFKLPVNSATGRWEPSLSLLPHNARV